MRKILGGKDNTCPVCGSAMLYVEIKDIGIVSQCKNCNSTVKGKLTRITKIYSY